MLTGWDAAALSNYRLEDGTTYAQIVSEMNAALGALNGEFFGDSLVSSLASYTDEPDAEYRVGGSNGFELFTEYGRADAKRAGTEGHMIPLRAYDRRLGWTWNYLRQARMAQVRADIADGIKDARDRVRLSLLGRIFKRSDDSGKALGLGASGLSPGFATTAASTGVDFDPPAYGGTVFDTTHEHYVGITGGAFTAAVFTDAKDELREHGHEGPYEFIIGGADEAAVKALTGFVPTANNLITYGALQDLAQLNPVSDMNGAYYIGMLNDFKIRVVRGVPQYYGFGWKSYGPNSQRNPLRIRLRRGVTRPQVVAMPDPNAGTNANQPLNTLMLFMEFGVGVADRTNGTARYVNNTTWADGVAT